MIKAYEAGDILREKLSQGKVEFVFKKKDGSIRPAIGTTNLDLIPQDLHPKDMDGEYKPKDETSVTFFDLEKVVWRSCKSFNIKSIDGEEVE